MLDDENYEIKGKNFEVMRFFLGSFMRSRLLLFFLNNASDLDAMRKGIDKPTATILHSLKEFESLKLSLKHLKTYHLTSKGYLYALNQDKLCKNFYVFHSRKSFWQKHHINSFPDFFVKNAFLIKDSQYIVSEKRDLSKPFTVFSEYIDNCGNMKIILPIFSDIYLDVIINNVKKGHNLDLIVNDDVLIALKESGTLSKLFSFSKVGKITIRKYEGDLKIFLTLSKKFMTMNLFFNDGFFDDTTMILNETSDGVIWAENIFDYYFEKSVGIIL